MIAIRSECRSASESPLFLTWTFYARLKREVVTLHLGLDTDPAKSKVPKKSNMSNKPGASFVPTSDKVFRGQARDGILRLVVLILYRVKFGQHALMQDSRN